MTRAERDVPRHDLTRSREHVVDPDVRFYSYMDRRTPLGMAVVHTNPEDDKPAQQVFGEVGEKRMCDLRALFTYTPDETGLWIATIDGIKNSDFFLALAESPHGVVATSFSPENEGEYAEAHTYFLNRVVNHLGYREYAARNVTTDGKDPHRLSRAFFVPPALW